MKNVLKKLLAVVLVVTTLTMLFCISGNAIQIYNGNGATNLEVYLWTDYVYTSNPVLHAELQINSLSTYNIAVFDCGIIGYYDNTNISYNSYNSISQAYSAKIFDEDVFKVTQNTLVATRPRSASDVIPTYGGIVYVAGKTSSSYSSTYNYRLVEIDPVTLMPIHTTYFSNVASDCTTRSWYPQY